MSPKIKKFAIAGTKSVFTFPSVAASEDDKFLAIYRPKKKPFYPVGKKGFFYFANIAEGLMINYPISLSRKAPRILPEQIALQILNPVPPLYCTQDPSPSTYSKVVSLATLLYGETSPLR